MDHLAEFKGAGIYAIYYLGKNPIYKTLVDYNNGEARHPIYVGKADPKGKRKGVIADTSALSNTLWSRLKEHSESIHAADPSDLNLKDFSCRYLAVADIWIGLGESLLIQNFKPVWNLIADGFGNHDPGNGRYEGKKPSWDELHPGRAWAVKMKKPPKYSRAVLIAKIESELEKLKGV